MNYGKKNAAKIKWQLTSRETVMRRKVKSLTLLIILLCFVLVLGYGGYRVCGTDNRGSTGYQ